MIPIRLTFPLAVEHEFRDCTVTADVNLDTAEVQLIRAWCPALKQQIAGADIPARCEDVGDLVTAAYMAALGRREVNHAA